MRTGTVDAGRFNRCGALPGWQLAHPREHLAVDAPTRVEVVAVVVRRRQDVKHPPQSFSSVRRNAATMRPMPGR